MHRCPRPAAPGSPDIAANKMHEVEAVVGKGAGFGMGGKRTVCVLEADQVAAFAFKQCEECKKKNEPAHSPYLENR